MKISVFSPVKNEVDFIGYSVMSVLPYVHEIIYGVAPSDDGTVELLNHLKANHDTEGKLKIFAGGPGEPNWDFDPLDMKAYNDSYNFLIEQATGEAVWFLHPDMIVTNPEQIGKQEDVNLSALAWWTNISSFARDQKTEIVAGRTKRWKNIHMKDYGLHYFGGYGSQNEDMYFREITGDAYRHHGDEFQEYPFEVADSGINVNHYCELKSYKRRLEKMVRCLKTLYPNTPDQHIQDMAAQHPRVTLEASSLRFGTFRFAPSQKPIPSVFELYHSEFSQFAKDPVYA